MGDFCPCFLTEGSSPRVRGKRLMGRTNFPAWGLIPACAGKTGYLSAGKASVRAHPRVCGENCSS